MTSFLWGALGALAVLVLARLGRRAAGRRVRRAGPARLGWLFRRIGARPEQERALRAEADALAEAFLAFRGDARLLRGEVADLLAAPALDAAAVRTVLDARLAGIETLRARLADALARVHDTLDPAQRETVAAMLRRGARRHGCGGRGAHA